VSLEQIMEALDDLCEERGWEYGIEIAVAWECAWSCELRVTPNPNNQDDDLAHPPHHRPDRSYVTFAAGGLGPEDCLQRAYSEMRAWLDK
jgi:hypothetical protein